MKNYHQKAQVSVELVLLVGVLLAVTIPLFYFSLHASTENIKSNQALDSVNALARKADSVYSLGEGTRDHLWITIPGGVDYTSVGNQSISLFFSGNRGEVNAYTVANVTGNIPKERGSYRLLVERFDTYVWIGLANST